MHKLKFKMQAIEDVFDEIALGDEYYIHAFSCPGDDFLVVQPLPPFSEQMKVYESFK